MTEMKMNLKILRMRKGWTQLQLAQSAGTTEGTIVRIERHGKLPRPGMIKRLADALEVSTEQLLEEEQILQKVS